MILPVKTQCRRHRRVMEVILLKQKQIKCPYCHAHASLRPASLVYGSTPQTRGKFLYVCDRWPACNAYVSAHERTLLPSLMTTPVSRSTIFIAKLVVLTKSILAAQVLLMVFIIIVGKVVFRFEQPIPINMLWWLFMGWFSALSVGAVQLYLSMRIRSFAVPVGLAVCLSVGGLAFHIAGLSEIFPYSQIILGLSSQDEALPIDSITTLVPMVLVYTVLFAVLATHHLKKADVVAG